FRARVLVGLAERDLFRRALGDRLLNVREMGVVVVADRADREAAGAVAERANDAQQALPEAEQVTRRHHLVLFFGARVDEAVEELGDLRKAEFLRLGGAGPLVDAEMQDSI